MKYSIIIIIFFISCRENMPVKETVVVNHDTVVISNFANESTVKELLIEYYKAGWMRGSDAVIDLHNDNTLSDKTIKMVRNIDWRKIENQVRSK